MQDEAEHSRLDKVHAQNQLKQIMQRSDEERVSLKSELVANQNIMMEMAERMASIQNQPMQNQSSSSMEVSTSSVPQWFDMEAPGGIGVAEKPKVPAL
eukprot:7439856-Karenia_brevis.AAC.1